MYIKNVIGTALSAGSTHTTTITIATTTITTNQKDSKSVKQGCSGIIIGLRLLNSAIRGVNRHTNEM